MIHSGSDLAQGRGLRQGLGQRAVGLVSVQSHLCGDGGADALDGAGVPAMELGHGVGGRARALLGGEIGQRRHAR